MFWASGPMLHPVKPPRNHHDPARQYEVVLMIHRLPTKLLTINLPLPPFQRRSMSLSPNHAQINQRLPSFSRKTPRSSLFKLQDWKRKSNKYPQENSCPRRLLFTHRTGKKSQPNHPKKIHIHAGSCSTPRTGRKGKQNTQEKTCPRGLLFNPQD